MKLTVTLRDKSIEVLIQRFLCINVFQGPMPDSGCIPVLPRVVVLGIVTEDSAREVQLLTVVFQPFHYHLAMVPAHSVDVMTGRLCIPIHVLPRRLQTMLM